jgi:glycosyltransferase involved in cell wall biosynthesis
VRFEGKQNETQLRRLFSRASIYAATSRYEPFGLAPVEAALSRCALLMNDIPVFRELWGDAALYFERNRGSSLRQKLTELHQDPILRREFANRAYTRARRAFGSERMVNDYLELYRAMAAQHVAAA